MTTTRRTFVKSGTAAAALAAAPGIARVQATPPANKTLRVAMMQDLNSFDPVLSTSLPTSYHSHAIYDTLFGLDANFNPRPQMLSKWGVSDDRRTYTFELRDGLRFSDCTPVTTADCVASGTSGAKVAKIDRVVWQNIQDAQTALAALQNGEIDFYEAPPVDLISGLELDPNIAVDVLNKSGWVGMLRPNHLHPPFNNVKARQALKYVVNPIDMMKAFVGNSKFYGPCTSYFGCGLPMENDENTGWYKEGQNIAKAAQLFKEAGYDGRPVIMMQPTDLRPIGDTTPLIAQWLRQAGVNVQVDVSDWGVIAVRRGKKEAPDKGGWNLFSTFTSGYQLGANPFFYWGHSAVGDKGGFVWPENAEHERLRAAWAAASTLQERQAIARQMQAAAWEWIPYTTYGRWLQPVAYRKNVKGLLAMPEIIPFWNVEKT